MRDIDGKFLGNGKTTTIMSNNPNILGKIPGCSKNAAGNNYYCDRGDMGVVEWEDISDAR